MLFCYFLFFRSIRGKLLIKLSLELYGLQMIMYMGFLYLYNCVVVLLSGSPLTKRMRVEEYICEVGFASVDSSTISLMWSCAQYGLSGVGKVMLGC